MNPVLLRLSRPYLAGYGLLGSLTACCAIAQAWLLAHAVATVSVPRALVAVVAVRAVLAWAHEVLGHRAATGVKSALRARLLTEALQTPGVSSQSSGEFVALVTRGLDALDPYFARYLPQLVIAVIVPLSVLAALLCTDLVAGLIVAVTLPLIPLFGALIGSYAAARTRRQWRALETLAGHFADVVAGLPTLKVFGRARAQAAQISRITGEHRQASLATLRLAFCSALVLELAVTLSVAVVAVSVGLRLVSGSLTFETALFVLILAPEAYLPLRLAGTHFHAAQEGLSAAASIPSTRGVSRTSSAKSAGNATSQRVVLDRVVVREGAGAVSLELRPGTVTVLTGPSGIGKSSVIAALLGFVTPVSGRLEVPSSADGFGESWRRQVTWLPQSPFLFTGTVADNIALGVPGAPVAAVRAAAEALGVPGFTSLHATVGEAGGGLSAGQRQRIALARAVLRCELLGTWLVLLDEPTAHLDIPAELDARDALSALLPGRTTLIVTHRQALRALADSVVELGAAPLPSSPAGALSPVRLLT